MHFEFLTDQNKDLYFDTVVKYNFDCFLEYNQKVTKVDIEGLSNFWKKTILEHPTNKCIMLLDDKNTIIGIISIVDQDIEGYDYSKIPPNSIWITDLFVTENNRGKGYARALIDQAVKYIKNVKEPKIENIYLSSPPELISYYSKLGCRVEDLMVYPQSNKSYTIMKFKASL